jgi:hypothetical protein
VIDKLTMWILENQILSKIHQAQIRVDAVTKEPLLEGFKDKLLLEGHVILENFDNSLYSKLFLFLMVA